VPLSPLGGRIQIYFIEKATVPSVLETDRKGLGRTLASQPGRFDDPVGRIGFEEWHVESCYSTQPQRRFDPDFLYAGRSNGRVCGFH
jgi:hypothetical protein